MSLSTWWRKIRRKGGTPPDGEDPATPGNGHVAEWIRDQSKRDLDRTRERVDTWTSEVRTMLGGRP